MADYRRIITLLLEHHSYRDIEAILGCSHRDIRRASTAITIHDITRTTELTTDRLAEWFPDGRRRVSDEYETPDFVRVLRAMKSQRHYTLLQGWRKYVDVPTSATGLKRYGYSQFCALFAEHVHEHDLVATLHHEPGKVVFIDWAGDTMRLIDAVTGEVTKAVLFVATLPYSGVMFVRAYTSMKASAWLAAHREMLEFFGGVPRLFVPDNPTTATHRRRAGESERVVNATYQALADHYGAAVVPARVRRPRDKASVERAVKTVNTRVIGYLDADVFHTLDQLNTAISARVHEINEVMKTPDGSTRWQRFLAEEKPLLAGLPEDAFEDVVWREVRAGRNYHVTIETQKYSVPHRLAGRMLRARVTATRVTIFDRDDMVAAEHDRLTGRKGQYSTLPAHVPAEHADVDGLWSREWFLTRAARFGEATVWAITRLLEQAEVEAQAFLDCQNVLDGLGRRNHALLEAACEQARRADMPVSYTVLKRLMAGIPDDAHAVPAPRPAASTAKKQPSADSEAASRGVFVRDASHYLGEGGAW